MTSQNPRVILVGTGAVGGYFGARLAQAGAHISAVCRSDFETVTQKGITVKSVAGDAHFMPFETVRRIEDCTIEPEYIVIATKVLPDAPVASLLRDRVPESASIVLLQNGIAIEEPVSAAYPRNEIISAIPFICAVRVEPGLVHHTDFGRIVIGTYPSGASERAERLASLFQKANVPCTISENIITARWIKCLWNGPFNPISVLCRADTRQMMESTEVVELAVAIMREIQTIAEAEGHSIPETAITTILNDTAAMTPYKTSMLIDFERRRPLEVEAILGNALAIAERRGIHCPHMKALYALLTLLDRNNRKAPALSHRAL